MNAKTLKQAMAACGSALVGTWTAKVNISAPGDTTGCVLAFNATVSGKPGLALFVSAIPLKLLQLRQPREQHEGHDRSAAVGHVERQPRFTRGLISGREVARLRRVWDPLGGAPQ